MAEGRELNVEYYETRTGTTPFRKWRQGVRDAKARQAVDARIARFRTGNLGVSRSVGGGVRESKIDLGPGYRIYYATDGEMIVLLCGGDKSTQDEDIRRAKSFWEDYKGAK
jgi:putative addiction module killer protein